MSRHTYRPKPTPAQMYLRIALVLAAAALLLGAIYLVSSRLEDSQFTENRGTLEEGFVERKVVTYKGQEYVHKSAMQTLLVIGVDPAGERESDAISSMRSGGQSDFLLLIVVDNHTKEVHRLQIDRDTIVNCVTLGVLGNETGTRELQICLSHAFGATEDVRCGYTVIAAQNLLQGEKIDDYYSMNWNAVGSVNHALGGVPVTIEDDMTSIDPALTPGARVTLTDTQAAYYLRMRMTIGDGTNVSRMRRQRAYMNSAFSIVRSKLQEDAGFAQTLFDSVSDYATSSLTQNELASLLLTAANYKILPVEVLESEHVIGPTGFMECHVSEETALDWVISTFYQKKV